MTAQSANSIADVAGYVLAGGRSSRMGKDKALLQLGGTTLVQHAVRKLKHVADPVSILGSRSELEAFAPLVPDLTENCGPLGGIEAALDNARSPWVLVMPVDMPFVPAALIASWARKVVGQSAARVAMFCADNVVHPALCLVHADVAPYVTRAIKQRRFKLYPALEEAARETSREQNVNLDEVLLVRDWNEKEADVFHSEPDPAGESNGISRAQWLARHLWFANLNTPKDFADAERYVDALDT